jgi:hypothetical protein
MSRMTEEKDPKVEALEAVRAESARHKESQLAEERQREAHHAAVVAALKAGVGPSAIERVSHYDRQHIDRIRRAASIPPRRAATVQKIPKDE